MTGTTRKHWLRMRNKALLGTGTSTVDAAGAAARATRHGADAPTVRTYDRPCTGEERETAKRLLDASGFPRPLRRLEFPDHRETPHVRVGVRCLNCHGSRVDNGAECTKCDGTG